MKVTIGNSLSAIKYMTFSYCTSLTSIEIPDSVKVIDWKAFYSCANLSSVRIGDSVRDIGNDAFYACTALKSITLPRSVIGIGSNAIGYYSRNSIASHIDDFVIYGYRGTAAEEYALNEEFTFVALDDMTVAVTGISLNKTAVSLSVGGTVALTATITPSNATNKTVIWSSSNTSVATVSSSGVVTAKAAGAATITARTNNGKTATCTVTVSNPTVEVTGISLNRTSASLTVGGTVTLTATVTPSNATNKTVTWSSSNTSVATVSSSGVVTAKAAGAATITAKTNNGKTATCVVSVSNPTVAVTGISLNKTAVSLSVGGTVALTATITPSNATNKTVTWSSSNTSVATVSSAGVVTAKAAGSATITAKTSNGKGATCAISVNLATPVISKVENTYDGVKITWGKISGAAKYRVFRKTGSGSWQKVGDTANLTCLNKAVTSNTKYTYTIRCVSSDGKTFTSNYDKTGKSITYIAAPRISKLENTAKGIKITWGAVKGASKYRIYRMTEYGTWKKVTDCTTSYCGIGGLYTFTVRALNAKGETVSGYYSKGWSKQFIATPAKPTLKNTKSGVSVSWKKVTGAQKYRVFRKTSSSGWAKVADTTSLSYVDKSAKTGTTYYYTIRCISKDAKSFTSGYDTTGSKITCKK